MRHGITPQARPMCWIALLLPEAQAPARPASRAWPLLQFTPRVALLDEAVVMDVSPVLRLWGGRARLLHRLRQTLQSHGGPPQACAQGDTALVALALARLQVQGQPAPRDLPAGLPLEVLSAARPHLSALMRLGCRRWGDLRALPRAGLARRFGAALSDALDQAWGLRPHGLPWLTLPPVFDESLELPQPARQADEMLDAARALLQWLQLWLRQRQLGVLALRWDWHFDLHRIDGMTLPPQDGMVLRTAQATQDAHHLLRLLHERWARTALQAPARSLRLCSEQVQPWQGLAGSWLPDALPQAQRLHVLVERLQARLGDAQVCTPVPCEDHRPECMQRWQSAQGSTAQRLTTADTTTAPMRPPAGPSGGPPALLPPWLLQQPLALPLRDGQPWHQGPLRLLTRAQRIEAGWWDGGARRDYYVAHGERAGWLWVFCEPSQPPRWFLHGLFA